jgi:hypothetical protein
MLCELLHVFNGTSDFHYSKPTPFVPALQAVAPAIRHILRHTRASSLHCSGFRHTTSMTAKYNCGATDAATHRAEVRARVAGDNYACGATARN